jgi:ATP-dependent Lon protease
MSSSRKTALETGLAILPLRDVVVFPHMVMPLFIGRERSIRALEYAMERDKRVMLVAQRTPEVDDPKSSDLYEYGTISSILQLLKLPDGTIKVLVEGSERARVAKHYEQNGLMLGEVEALAEDEEIDPREAEVMSSNLLTQFEQLVKLNRKLPPELLASLNGINDVARLAYTIVAHLNVRLADKQTVLEAVPLRQRVEALLGLIDGEVDVLQIEKRIRGRVKTQMEKSQRDYYLNEQMKAIQRELGEGQEDHGNELDELQKRISNAQMPEAVQAKAKAEYGKLKLMPPMSAEATVVRNYLDTLLNIPWNEATQIRRDLPAAEKVLDADHYGLDKVKERILEYLAVQQRVKRMKGPILCLVGPPGVGKTSLGQSIARATNRKFVRISLGGVRDEAEIRGHRRTYIGSMPGRIVQNLIKSKARNPLMMLDELDKMSMDFRGDPSAALLEVLDPEQNHAFNDHYLEVDLDLSDVMFIGTANSLNIPSPLLDRMEIIRIPGYTEDEKLAIATRYLLPKQIKANGLKESEISLSERALLDTVRYYTREAGVRSLEREMAKLCRKVVKELAMRARKRGAKTGEEKSSKSRAKAVSITPKNLDQYLGVRKFRYGLAEENHEVGLVTGLAWTEVGGELLSIEAAVLPGKGKLTQTGSLGDVMQESIAAALSVVRARTEALGIDSEFHQKLDLHVHVPEGATPKDGPSAGIGMCTALVSALTKIPVRADIAMTGEITLRGRVLPIGGLKEKLLAAHRGGIKRVLIPEDNAKDLADIPDNIKGNLEIKPVRWIDQVLDLALTETPKPKSATQAEVGNDEQSKVSEAESTQNNLTAH